MRNPLLTPPCQNLSQKPCCGISRMACIAFTYCGSDIRDTQCTRVYKPRKRYHVIWKRLRLMLQAHKRYILSVLTITEATWYIAPNWRNTFPMKCVETHWGRVTHICVSKLITIIGSENGLSPERRQAIMWTNAEILLIEPPGTRFSEIFIEIHTISFMKMQLKM